MIFKSFKGSNTVIAGTKEGRPAETPAEVNGPFTIVCIGLEPQEWERLAKTESFYLSIDSSKQPNAFIVSIEKPTIGPGRPSIHLP